MTCQEEIQCGKRVIIGIRNYTECSIPESGLFINDLPGMSLKKAAQISTEQWQSANDFLKSCIRMAVMQVFDEFAGQLQNYFNFSSIIQSRILNKFTTNQTPAINSQRGLLIKRWRSEAARLYIYEIYINVVQAGSATINLYDGSKTTQYDINLNAGLNTIQIDYKAESEKVYITFDQTNFDVFECTYINGYNNCGSCGYTGDNKNIYVTGWDGIQEKPGNCYGIGINLNVQCYEEEILCFLIKRMYYLIWYKSGIIFMNEFINSDRINYATLFGKEQAESTKADWEIEYNTKYQILVKSAYNFLKSTKGECITCNGMKYVESIP